MNSIFSKVLSYKIVFTTNMCKTNPLKGFYKQFYIFLLKNKKKNLYLVSEISHLINI